jgi:hypothetical protein
MTEADWPFVLLVDPELTHQTHFNVIRCPYRNLYPVGERANRVMLMPDGRHSHTAVDCIDQLISLKGAA